MLSPETIHTYVDILREELVPATGCTEPIAIAYAAALLRQTLGAAPERVLAEVSGNIIKNVKSVIVPNTGGLKGIQAAVAAGVVAGRADQILQVISDVPEDKLGDIARYAKETPIQVECAHTPRLLDIVLTGWAGDHTALVHIADSHSNVVRVERDGQVLREKALDAAGQAGQERKMSVEDILAFPGRWTWGWCRTCWTGRLNITAPLPPRASAATGAPISAPSSWGTGPPTSKPRPRPGPPPAATPE